MAISGAQKAYTSARSGIARSGATRSNYVFPDVFGVVVVGGVDLTGKIRADSLHVTMAINDQPDTCTFDAFITDAATDAALVVGADVRIGLGGPSDNVIFGGRIVTVHTARHQGHVPSLRSVMCADYLQVLDSEYLVTYGWPSQSATTTILDLVARFANRAGGLPLTAVNVAAGLPTHQAFGVANERFSTVMRRMVTMFPTPGGFYVDPLKDLHAWIGAQEPGQTNPSPLTLANFHAKQFALTRDGSQVRDAVIVEGVRTKAPIGTPPPGDYAARVGLVTFPVEDASIIGNVTDQAGREIRVGSQRMLIRYAQGRWSGLSPDPNNNPTSSIVSTALVAFNPGGAGDVAFSVASDQFIQGRGIPCWVKVEEQYLLVKQNLGGVFQVPRVGFGAQTADIRQNMVVAAIDSFASGTTTGRYDTPGAPETIRAQPVDSDVVMTYRSFAAPAVHEQLVQDGRYVISGAANRGSHEVQDFKSPAVLVEFETTDMNAKPGRLQAYAFTEPPIAETSGSYMIVSAEFSWPVWGEPPRRVCTAANVQSANITDAWVVDPR